MRYILASRLIVDNKKVSSYYVSMHTLHSWLKTSGYKTNFVAKKLNITRYHLWSVATGKRRLSTDLADAIYKFTGGDVDLRHQALRGSTSAVVREANPNGSTNIADEKSGPAGISALEEAQTS